MKAMQNDFLKPQAEESSVYQCGDDVIMYFYENFSREQTEQYISALEAGGFEKTDSYESDGNVFASFSASDALISLDFFDDVLRVVFDPFSAPLKLHDECDEKCDTVLWQHEVDHTLIDCGMCYIVKCCDGSFFIMDSGHFFQMNDNDRIHKFMRERTPAGEKIRIAGWFLTHAHSDHICKFLDFIKYNMDDCELEAVYYNFTDERHADRDKWDKYENVLAKSFTNQIAEYKNLPQIKLHMGQRFCVRNLKFTVLCTHESCYPQTLTNFNDTSTVLMMEAQGSRVLLLGDAGEVESRILEKRWGEKLRCDILQVAHHGHFGCTKELYALAKARVALFSNTRIFFDLDLIKEKEANEEILAHCELYRVSSEGTTQIVLPYTSKECLTDLPDETHEDFDRINQLWGYEYSDEFKQNAYESFLKRSGK